MDIIDHKKLGLLVRLDPTKARRMVLAAYKQCDGVELSAAKLIGCGINTLKRWRAALGIEVELKAMREAATAKRPVLDVRKLSPAQKAELRAQLARA
jgi:hypothetical protein